MTKKAKHRLRGQLKTAQLNIFMTPEGRDLLIQRIESTGLSRAEFMESLARGEIQFLEPSLGN